MMIHELSRPVMEDLVGALEADPLVGLEELWEALVPGWETADHRLKVWDHSLTATQGRRLAQAAMDGGGGLAWLNWGPSTQEVSDG